VEKEEGRGLFVSILRGYGFSPWVGVNHRVSISRRPANKVSQTCWRRSGHGLRALSPAAGITVMKVYGNEGRPG